MADQHQVPKALRLTLYAAGFVIIMFGLQALAPILRPVALAGFIAAVSLPALTWLRRQGIHPVLAILLVVLIDAALLFFVGWVMFRTAAEVSRELPVYSARVVEIEQAIRAKFLSWGIEITPGYYESLIQPERLLGLITGAARQVTSVLSLFFLVLLFLIFLMAESIQLPRRLEQAGVRGFSGARTVLREVQRYLGLKTIINLITGLGIGIGAAVIGVDFALFWGMLAFLLNYIPNIGSFVAGIPAVMVALLQLGLGPAVALTVVYLAVNISVGNFLDPFLVGRKLRLSPVILLVSLLFWGWVWGGIGMFLAVPLTIAIKIGFENSTEFRNLAVFMGPVRQTPLPPSPPGT